MKEGIDLIKLPWRGKKIQNYLGSNCLLMKIIITLICLKFEFV